MLRRLFLSLQAVFLVFCISSCVSAPSSPAGQKELKLKWNVSYIRGLVIVKEALNSEPIKFDKAAINKNVARLKGVYADGRLIEIVITGTGKSESNVAVNLGTGEPAKSEARGILEKIAQYSKGVR